jgi:hypothetical protein
MTRRVLATVGCAPLNHDGAVIHEDRPGRVAGDHDGVVQLIADNPQRPPGGGKGGRDRRQHALGERLDRRPEPAVIGRRADRPANRAALFVNQRGNQDMAIRRNLGERKGVGRPGNGAMPAHRDGRGAKTPGGLSCRGH